jgi:hypothetical protein
MAARGFVAPDTNRPSRPDKEESHAAPQSTPVPGASPQPRPYVWNGPTRLPRMSVGPALAALKSKAGEWLRRYLPAEAIGACTALLGAAVSYSLLRSYLLAAIAGTIGEAIGFYGYFVIQGVRGHYHYHRHYRLSRRLQLVAVKTLRDLTIEFGVAEAFDSILIRPVLMYTAMHVINNLSAGLLAGKLAADLVFYGFAIVGYEIKTRWIVQPAESDKVA